MQAANFPTATQNGTPQNRISAPQDSRAQRQQILQILRSKPTPPGWQQPFRIDQRISFIIQITSALHLLRPNLTDGNLGVALSFEENKFNSAPDEQEYKKACYQKLQDIAKIRQGQANQAMNTPNLMNAGMMAGGQQQRFQQSMVTQNQQASGYTNQTSQPQQIHQMQGPAMAQQQQQQHQLQRQQMANAASMQNYNVSDNQNMNTQAQAPSIPVMQGLQDLTLEERQQVQQRAAQIANNLTPEQRQELATKAQTVEPHVKHQLAARNMNPIQLFIQHEAVKQIRMLKERRLMQESQGMPMPNAGGQAGPQPHMTSQGMPNQQNPQQGMPAQGNMTQHIIAQQQEALRRQQQGQQVVPGNQGGFPNGMPQNQQQMNQASQPNGGWQGQPPQGVFQAQNQSLWNQQNRQMPQNQPQSGTPSGPQNNNLQGQKGGLIGNVATGQHQQTPAMPTLNQPMNQSAQAQHGPSPRPGQATVQNQSNAQRPDSVAGQRANDIPQQVNSQVNINQQRQLQAQFLQNLPPSVKQQLQTIQGDEERRRYLLMVWQQTQRQNAQGQGPTPQGLSQGQLNAQQQRTQQQQPSTQQQQHQQPAPPTQQQQPPPPQHQQPQSMTQGRPMNNQNSQTAMVNGPSPNVTGANVGPQRPPGVAQGSIPLNEHQLRVMDNMPFPQGIRAQPVFQNLPDSVRLWGHLKQFVRGMAHNLPHGFVDRLNEHQANHFRFEQGKRFAQNQNNPAGLTQQAPPNLNQAPINRPPATMAQVPMPSQQDIQNIRNTQAGAQNMTDEQILMALMQRRHAAMGNAQNMANMNQQQQMQYQAILRAQQARQNQANRGQPQPSMHPAQQAQPSVQQPKQAPQRAPQANMTQNNAVIPEKPRQPSNQTPAKNNQKGLKRQQTSDDVVEIADPNLPKQPPINKAQASASASMQPITQQQFNAMSAEQKRLYAQSIQRRAAMEKQKQSQTQDLNQNQGQQARSTGDNKEELLQANKRVKEMLLEISSSIPRKSTPKLSAQTRSAMVHKLTQFRPVLSRIEPALTFKFVRSRNEEEVKQLGRMVDSPPPHVQPFQLIAPSTSFCKHSIVM